jgi:N-acetylglucosaminyl-diphospho-decaprenol L-rhamnosyltransferase
MQAAMVKALLADLNHCCKTYPMEVILTLNLPEALPFGVNDFSYPIVLHVNQVPMGFAANHNQAFKKSSGHFYCVLNPDIRIKDDPFRLLLLAWLNRSTVGVVAPLVLRDDGAVEDSARRFPTPLKILCKAIGKCKDNDYVIGDEPFHPDWVGGMFMLFPRIVFEHMGGFDERYFLYYEDVDLCGRLRLAGYEVLVNPQTKVTHHAQRTSRRSVTYLRWHFTSMMRFFLSPVFWRLQRWVRP